jgi:hypothetical protein
MLPAERSGHRVIDEVRSWPVAGRRRRARAVTLFSQAGTAAAIRRPLSGFVQVSAAGVMPRAVAGPSIG